MIFLKILDVLCSDSISCFLSIFQLEYQLRSFSDSHKQKIFKELIQKKDSLPFLASFDTNVRRHILVKGGSSLKSKLENSKLDHAFFSLW